MYFLWTRVHSMWRWNMSQEFHFRPEKRDFSTLIVELFSESLWKPHSKYCKCWLICSDWQKISSLNVTWKFSRPGSTKSGALTSAAVLVFRPKGVTRNPWYLTSWRNAMYFFYSSARGICQKLLVRSIVDIILFWFHLWNSSSVGSVHS